MAGFLTFTKEKPINRVVEVDIGEIRPNPHQPRSEFDIADIQSLADSILQNGILQPLTVRRGGMNSSPANDGCVRQSWQGCEPSPASSWTSAPGTRRLWRW